VSDVGVTMVVAVQLGHAVHPGWPPMSDPILEYGGYEVNCGHLLFSADGTGLGDPRAEP